MMFTPCWPSAGPTGGAGVACPAGICNLMNAVTFFAIVNDPNYEMQNAECKMQNCTSLILHFAFCIHRFCGAGCSSVASYLVTCRKSNSTGVEGSKIVNINFIVFRSRLQFC